MTRPLTGHENALPVSEPDAPARVDAGLSAVAERGVITVTGNFFVAPGTNTWEPAEIR